MSDRFFLSTCRSCQLGSPLFRSIQIAVQLSGNALEQTRQTHSDRATDRVAARAVLRGLLQLNDGKMSSPDQVSDVQVEALAASPSHGNLRLSTGAAPRPSSSWLESRRTAGGREIEVDLVRSSSVKRTVRPMAVVPFDEQRELTEESRPVIGNDEPARALVLDGPDESLDNREAAIFLDGAEALSDTAAVAPAPEAVIRELPAMVGHQMTWTGSCLPECSPEGGSDGRRSRLLLEDCESHDPTGEVINSDHDPPAEWQAVRWAGNTVGDGREYVPCRHP